MLIGLIALAVLGCEPGAGGDAEVPDAGGRGRADGPSIVLITVDTLRADRLGSYGHPLDTSPHIDALATRGVRFADATVQWPKTWPSLASLFSGVYPQQNGIGVVLRVLPEQLVLLPEILGEAGYETAAVVANFNVGRATGFDQGFDHFVESWQEKWEEAAGEAPFVNAPGRVKEYTNATIVTDQALRWLWSRSDPKRPYFLWLHYMDPHGPYLPPPRYHDLFEGRYRSAEIPLTSLPDYQRQQRPGGVVTDLGFYQAQYDREIRYLDDELGRLFEQLEHLEGEPPIVVLTADHGESLGEHDYYLEHGLLPYQPTAQVPLIFAGPGIGPPGRRIDAPVGLVDLSATLVELAGLPIPEAFRGTSLAAQVRGDEHGELPRHVFMLSGQQEDRPQRTIREGRWKLIRVEWPRERRLMTGSEYELYDLEADPGESRDVADLHPEVRDRLAEALDAWYGDGLPREAPGRARALDVESLDPRDRAMLRELGYVE